MLIQIPPIFAINTFRERESSKNIPLLVNAESTPRLIISPILPSIQINFPVPIYTHIHTYTNPSSHFHFKVNRPQLKNSIAKTRRRKKLKKNGIRKPAHRYLYRIHPNFNGGPHSQLCRLPPFNPHRSFPNFWLLINQL